MLTLVSCVGCWVGGVVSSGVKSSMSSVSDSAQMEGVGDSAMRRLMSSGSEVSLMMVLHAEILCM